MSDMNYALAEPGCGTTILDMNNEVNLFGFRTNFSTTSFDSYAKIDDEPVEMEVVQPKPEGLLRNKIIGFGVAALFAVAAVAVTVATGGTALLAMGALAGCALGAAVVTQSACAADEANGQARGLGEFLCELAEGVFIGGMFGAFAAELSVPLAAASTATETAAGWGLFGTTTAFTLNDLNTIGSGNNEMCDTLFGGNEWLYNGAELITAILSCRYIMSVGKPKIGGSSVSEGANSASKLFDYADEQLDVPSSVWDEGPVVRGDVIDNAEGLANNLGHNFPTVDSLNNGVLASTKSYDTCGKTYSTASKWLSKLKTDLNKLNSFTGRTWNGVRIDPSMYNSKALNVVIPNVELTASQKAALEQAKAYAKQLGITIKVYVTK